MKKRLLSTFLLSMFLLPVIAQVTRLSDNTSYDLGLALTDTKILLRSGITKTLWVYDIPGNSFTELNSTVTVEPDASYGLMNGKVYFAGKTVADGIELWVTDGTPGGTTMVKNINPLAADSEPKDGFVVYNNELYFSANDGTSGRELWKTNGTDAGTVRVKDINPGIGDAFTADIFPTQFGTQFGLVNGVLVFTASSSITPPVPPPGNVPDRELWKTDGTELGTSLLKDINPGLNPSYISSLTPYNNNLLFSAFDPTNGDALWRTDGTVVGTVIVKDFDLSTPVPPPLMIPSIVAAFFSFQSKLYFTANDGTNGFELWVTDATTGGTSLVKDINPGAFDAFPTAFFGFSFLPLAVKNTSKFFFAATTEDEGQELWESDGTGPGTKLLKDIVPGLGEGSDALPIPNFLNGGLFQGNKFFVIANTPLEGTELWISDGTAGGTQMVKDIFPGTNDGIDGSIIFYTNDKAYLTANDGVHGEEFWQTDGTGPGTVMVQDVNITPTIAANSDMQIATIASNKLYLFGTDGNGGLLTDFFRVDAPLTALPLRWISFDARPSNDDVLLTWETAEEEQTDHFIVQRSADGRTYFDLGRVNAHGIGSNQYSFSDLNAMRTTSVKKWFYRVKYVDKDAKSALSRTATVALNKLIASILILPNPVVNELKLAIESVNSGAGTLSVINMEGKTVLQKSINIHRGKTIVVTDASGLPNGAYLLQVTTSRDGTNTAERFLIQR